MPKQEDKLRRKKINVMLNEEERRIITEKAIQYGYGDCLAKYIRAACIYENIYVEDVEGKTEVCDTVSNFIEILRKILKEQQRILKNVMLSSNDINVIAKQNSEIIDMIESLSRLIISSLSVKTEKQIQRRNDILDKYRFNAKFFKKIIKNKYDIVTVRPSNLYRPNFEIFYIVLLPSYTYTFDLNNTDTDELFLIVYNFRDIAMQKQLLLSFIKKDNFLKVGVSMNFDDYEKAKKFAQEIATEDIYDLSKHMDGDIYSNNS